MATTPGTYGATGHSTNLARTLSNGASFDLYDEDEDYEYLPLPEVDEDYLDDVDAGVDANGRREVQKRIPFLRIHQEPVPFDSPGRQCFMPGQRITVCIVNVGQSDQSQLLSRNLYMIQVTHGDYKWTLCRRYKHFKSVHDSLLVLRAKAHLAMPTKEARERRKSFARRKQNVPKFPKRPEPLVRTESQDERQNQLEAYLQGILRCPQFRNHPETLKFLEVSHLSFVSGLGPKLKEGLVEKRAGGRRVALHCCMCCQPGHWQQRYLLLKDTFIAYLRPQDGTISDVLLMDCEFSVSSGIASTGVRNGLLISNLSRHLLLKCWTQRKTKEWFDAIQQAVQEHGDDFVKPNRYGSFAPVRPNTYVNWFVDGASYMAAVADGIEAAKEEIFITDWMLSPELYLKRPALEGDRWRLDKLLERKASEGVRIFILVYKEMEMAVGINSYYTKTTLSKLHATNIKVMRHPDGIKLWSHHEKCVVIDQRLAFLGGIDLCYGRWDTRMHRLSDVAQNQLSTFYGTEDANTLQNVLHNVPNIVPRLLEIANLHNNNNASDAKPSILASLIRRPLTSITEDANDSDSDAEPQTSSHVAVAHIEDVRLSVSRDADGGYSNPAVVGDAETKTGERSESVDSKAARKLVRQKQKISDDDERRNSAEPLASDRGSSSRDDSALTDENTTLHTFLKTIASRPHDIISRLDSSASQPSAEASKVTSDGSSSHISRLDSVEQHVDAPLTDEQKAAILQMKSPASAAKPTTPKTKRKAKKTVSDLRVLFQKHRSESLDVTDDGSSRPWDSSVYDAKEKNSDAEYDAQLARRGLCGAHKIWIGKDYVNFIFKDFVELDNPFTDMVDRTVTPRMPWHDIAGAVFGKPARDVARHFIQRWNFTKLEKKKTNPDIPMLLPKSNTVVSVPRWAVNSAFNCNCQILRSSCDWSAGIKHVEGSIHNAYIDLILSAKHYIYIENQFFISINQDSVVHNQIAAALYERILQAHRKGETFRVYVIMPLLPAFEGELGTNTGTSIQAVVHWNYASICRGGKSLLERLTVHLRDPFEYISFYGLRKHEEMCGNLTTELIYVHSKLMIIDDFSVIIASANINDRSMLGSRDSELGILVQDTCTVDSVMDGKPYKAGAFACSLRKSLFREHLGADSDTVIDVTDPISIAFYKNVWLKQASINTTIYDKVFCCLPTDEVKSLRQLRDYQKRSVLAQTHPNEAREQLRKVQGHLVLLPLHFLAEETLTPAAGTKEALAPTVIWT